MPVQGPVVAPAIGAYAPIDEGDWLTECVMEKKK